MDIREVIQDDTEIAITTVNGVLKGVWTAMPATVSQDTQDGHTSTMQPTIQRLFTDPVTGEFTYSNHPDHPDVPIHFAGGGGVTATHPVKSGDEGLLIYMSRPLDTWHASGGTQAPIDGRMHDLADGVHIPGVRSDPRKLQQVSNESHQVRSDDKLHVIDHHPQSGTTIKSADPSTPPASAGFDPFLQAAKYIQHTSKALEGVIGVAVDGNTEHSHGVDHGPGAWMKAANGLHSVLADPSAGASMNANNLEHSVKAHPDLGALLSAAFGQHMVQADPNAGVQISSSMAINLACPSGGLSLPSGGVSAGALASGSAASNVGALGGDLSGTLPDPEVVGLSHVDAHLLPVAASDALAAAAGVPIGGLYLNKSFVLAGAVTGGMVTASGIAVLCVRLV